LGVDAFYHITSSKSSVKSVFELKNARIYTYLRTKKTVVTNLVTTCVLIFVTW